MIAFGQMSDSLPGRWISTLKVVMVTENLRRDVSNLYPTGPKYPSGHHFVSRPALLFESIVDASPDANLTSDRSRNQHHSRRTAPS